MATQALALQSAQQQPDRGMPEASGSTPMRGKPEDRLAAFGLQPGDEQLFIDVLKLHKDEWEMARRAKLREVLRAIEYDKGNQFIVWDPFTQAYYNPFAQTNGGQQGTEQGNDSGLYQTQSNIIQWLRRVWTSTLGASVPGVEWWPGDTESDLDNKASTARGRAYRKIASDNNEKEVLEQCLDYLFLTGSYFRYIRWSMDKTITGTRYEDIVQWQPQTIAPERFTCPECGTDNPATALNRNQPPACINCHRPLSDADYYPATTLRLPVVTGQREVPNGQVRWDIYSLLNVEIMPQANTNGGGPIANTPLLDLSCEITKGALRRMYPDAAWELTQGTSTDAASPSGEMNRLARYRAITPGASRGLVAPKSQPTLHRVWYNPDAAFAIDEREKAQRMADLVKDGCCAVIVNNKIVDIFADEAKKRWTWCGAKKGVGALPPAPVYVALDFQDRLNDRTNAVDEFHDRAGSPPILYNQTVLGEELNGKFLPPASLLGVAVNQDVGRTLSDNIWQPKFQMDNGVYQWIDKLVQMVQLLVGVVPQTYGGHQQGIDTATGQEQALKVAMGVLWLYWNQVRGEWTESANNSVDCFADNALDDDYSIVKSDDTPDFNKEPIRLADLKGKAHARPEANQDYPIGYEQQRELYKELFMMANGKDPNPLVMEILDTYENRRQAMRYLGPPDMELPETPVRDMVLDEIAQLMDPNAAPQDSINPLTGQTMRVPTVIPNKLLLMDNYDFAIKVAVRYAIKHAKELRTQPAQFENLELYIKMIVEYQAETAAPPPMAALPPGPGAPGPSAAAPQ